MPTITLEDEEYEWPPRYKIVLMDRGSPYNEVYALDKEQAFIVGDAFCDEPSETYVVIDTKTGEQVDFPRPANERLH